MMQAKPASEPLLASLFDRLCDEPSGERLSYQASLGRDLEALLNSKINWQTWSSRCQQLDQSLLRYGLPDFAAMPLSSQAGRAQLCTFVAETIAHFEPRLREVSVTTVNRADNTERTLRLNIEAVCQLASGASLINFNSEVQAFNLGMRITGQDYG